jgi:hypothetical protein
MPLSALYHLGRNIQTLDFESTVQEKIDNSATTPAPNIKRPTASRHELQRPLVLLYAVGTIELRTIPMLCDLVVA